MRNMRLAVAVIATVSCSSELIRLGDGPTGSATAGATSTAGGHAGQKGEGGTSIGFAGATFGGSTGIAGSNAGGSAGTTGNAAAGSAGTARSTACAHRQVDAAEVLWIGDSWVTIPGTQHTRVRDLALASGAIDANEDYVIAAAAASTLVKVVDQYNAQEAGPTKVRVLIMDGGTWDTYLSGGTDASVTKVSDTFEQFLVKIASDGTVEHIIYYLVPELATVPGVAALRPHLRQSCAQSAERGVPCHFLDLQLDLQPPWADHPEYLAADGIQASETGARVIAEAIWVIMQENCIAQ
jgi:hypothetical protein